MTCDRSPNRDGAVELLFEAWSSSRPRRQGFSRAEIGYESGSKRRLRRREPPRHRVRRGSPFQPPPRSERPPLLGSVDRTPAGLSSHRRAFRFSVPVPRIRSAHEQLRAHGAAAEGAGRSVRGVARSKSSPTERGAPRAKIVAVAGRREAPWPFAGSTGRAREPDLGRRRDGRRGHSSPPRTSSRQFRRSAVPRSTAIDRADGRRRLAAPLALRGAFVSPTGASRRGAADHFGSV